MAHIYLSHKLFIKDLTPPVRVKIGVRGLKTDSHSQFATHLTIDFYSQFEEEIMLCQFTQKRPLILCIQMY